MIPLVAGWAITVVVLALNTSSFLVPETESRITRSALGKGHMSAIINHVPFVAIRESANLISNKVFNTVSTELRVALFSDST